MLFGGGATAAPKKPAGKAPAKKPVAPAKKAAPKKSVAKKSPPKPVKKAVKTTNFAYGLPGNVNIIGGGDLDFDPYGFLEGKSKLEVYRYRECELTHGRVGMLAAVGFIVQEKFH